MKFNSKLLLDAVYPVGSIYMSINNTSPKTLFGGKWEQIKDVFLLAAGSTYTAGSTGGEAEHTLTVDEMPKHRHVWHGVNNAASQTSALGEYPFYIFRDTKPNWSVNAYMDDTGGSKAHNNMPPYLTVYVWKRTS